MKRTKILLGDNEKEPQETKKLTVNKEFKNLRNHLQEEIYRHGMLFS